MDPLDMAFCFATKGFTTEGSKAGAFNFFARTVDDYGKNDNTHLYKLHLSSTLYRFFLLYTAVK